MSLSGLKPEDHALIARLVDRQPGTMLRGHEGYYLHEDIIEAIQLIGRLAALLQAAREEAYKEGAGEPAKGWLYHCPDTGTEWSDNHPIESGEVPDAKDVRPATLDALHAELMAAWEVLAERPSPPNPQARIEALEGEVAELRAANERLARLGRIVERERDELANDLLNAAALNQRADHD